MATISTGIPGVLIHKEQWTQCENDNCQKWRKLPPGSILDEEAPWYCYMNSDPKHNRCSASEESYDEKTEIVLDAHLDDEEAVHNQLIRRHLEASIAARASLGSSQRGRGRGRGGGGGRGAGRRGRGRGRGTCQAAVQTDSDSEPDAQCHLSAKRTRALNNEEDGIAGFTEASQSKPLRQGIYYCLQALEQGSVEKNSKLLSASATASTISYTSLNSSAWEALHGQAPTLAILACEATDLTSGVRYFQDAPCGDAVSREATLNAKLALILNASCALVSSEHLLTPDEKARAGLSECP